MLLPVALVCTLVFPPLGLMVGAGGALYAHRVGNIVFRNVSIAFLVAVVALLVVLQSRSGF